jgi:putative phosphoribosyl transferase
MMFVDRIDAGQKLAKALESYKGRDDVALFALPRGGAVVAAEVSKALGMPFDLVVTRKIGSPANEEYALGALAETGETVWNPGEEDAASDPAVREIIEKEKREAGRRVRLYRNGRPLPGLSGKTAIIIDDGLATGATVRAAALAARSRNAKKVVVAVPHGAKDSLDEIRASGIEVVALAEPEPYFAVGQYYDDFDQVSDEQVLEIMEKAGKPVGL